MNLLLFYIFVLASTTAVRVQMWACCAVPQKQAGCAGGDCPQGGKVSSRIKPASLVLSGKARSVMALETKRNVTCVSAADGDIPMVVQLPRRVLQPPLVFCPVMYLWLFEDGGICRAVSKGGAGA